MTNQRLLDAVGNVLLEYHRIPDEQIPPELRLAIIELWQVTMDLSTVSDSPLDKS